MNIAAPRLARRAGLRQRRAAGTKLQRSRSSSGRWSESGRGSWSAPGVNTVRQGGHRGFCGGLPLLSPHVRVVCVPRRLGRVSPSSITGPPGPWINPPAGRPAIPSPALFQHPANARQRAAVRGDGVGDDARGRRPGNGRLPRSGRFGIRRTLGQPRPGDSTARRLDRWARRPAAQEIGDVEGDGLRQPRRHGVSDLPSDRDLRARPSVALVEGLKQRGL